MHLSYYLLKMVLRDVEGASATPSKLKIQATNLDSVKTHRTYQTFEHATQIDASEST